TNVKPAIKMHRCFAAIAVSLRRDAASVRHHDGHLDMTTRGQYLERYLIAMPSDPKVDTRCSQPQLAQHHLVEKRRQARVAHPDFAALGIELKSERRLQQCERRRARPRLRRTCNRIKRWPPPLLTAESAKQFRKPAQIHVGRGFEKALEQVSDRMLQAIPRKAECDQRVIVRPDRTIV